MKALISLSIIVMFASLAAGCGSPSPTPTMPDAALPEPTEISPPLATATPASTATATPLPPSKTPLPSATPLPTLSGRGGGSLAFAREERDQRDIYLVNADGSELTALTNDAFWDNWPSWSPDGSQLAFTCRQPVAGLGGGICAINVDGSNRRQLSNANDWEPTWSPDGQYIVFASQRDGNPEIYLMNADGSDERRLTHDPADDWQASWSRDSKRLAFVSARDGEWEIYLMDVSDGGIAGDSQLVKLTDNNVADGFPDWSPDGTRIVFSSMRDGNEEIYIMDTDGSNVQRLTFNDYDESFPRWSPDGLRIAYTVFLPANHIYSYDIAIMNANGSGQHQITRGNQVDEQCPRWKP
jgi:Tol biopolymer transport system component